MRLATALLLLLFYNTRVYAQIIDRLQTDEQALRFIKAIYPAGKGLALITNQYGIDRYTDSVSVLAFPTSTWYKADFDNNGHSDLLFNGFLNVKRSFVVLSFGNDSFQVKDLSYYGNQLFFFAARPLTIAGKSLIESMYVPCNVPKEAGCCHIETRWFILPGRLLKTGHRRRPTSGRSGCASSKPVTRFCFILSP